MSTTIAAISTPQGEGGIGVVRISGSQARTVADRIFKSKSGKKITDTEGYHALFGCVYDNESTIDEAVALVFAAPKSYTGEDVVEISVHGGIYVTRACLRAALNNGAVPAAAGEFTRRAYQNGKLGLVEAESVMSIISAVGKQELSLALAAKSGRIGREISAVRELLLSAAASMAVWADYPDEELPETDIDYISGLLRDAGDRLDRLIKDYDTGRLLREGVHCAIIGSPNVGKSTLMNLLSGDECSIVTEVAGTTRDVVEETVRVGDVLLRLADTAGVRETDDLVESIGVKRAFARAETAQLILAVFDGSRELCDDDRRILSLIKDKTAIAVINKTDKPQLLDISPFSSLNTVFISAATGEGRQELTAAVAEAVGANSLRGDVAVLTSERQRLCAEAARKYVFEALDTLAAGFTLDAVGVCTDSALEALLELTGERVTDTVADEVFSRFCVGK